MAPILVMEGICAAGVVFMICFLAVLLRGSKRKPTCQVVHLLSEHPQAGGGAFGLIAGWSSGKSDSSRPAPFEIVAGGTARRTRRAG
jgi:hypothetical protein